MARPKQSVDRDTDETELFYDSDFDADGFVDTMAGGEDHARKVVPQRPARQRVELRSEEKWLRQQLSDWDDLE